MKKKIELISSSKLISVQPSHTHPFKPYPYSTFQIGSMTVRTLVSGGVEVLVSQPGGSYVALICSCNTTAPSTEKNNKRNKKYNYNNSNYIYTNDDSEDSISVDGGKKDTANDDWFVQF